MYITVSKNTFNPLLQIIATKTLLKNFQAFKPESEYYKTWLQKEIMEMQAELEKCKNQFIAALPKN